MALFTQYHLVNFNDELTLLQISNFIREVLTPIQEKGNVYLSVKDFDRICGHGKTCKALRSCLIKVKGSCGVPNKDGETKPCLWELNEHNWNIFRETYAGFKALREKTKNTLDPIAVELRGERVGSTDSANNTALVAK